MSHTSQRRGLERSAKQEIVLLAAYPSRYKNKEGIGDSMALLARMILEHKPLNWLSRNFIDLDIPQLGQKRGIFGLIKKLFPEFINRSLFMMSARRSPVITALFNDEDGVIKLLKRLKREWLPENRQKGYPISIVLSGLHEIITQCCNKSGSKEHTTLYSLGFYGNTRDLPGEDELEIITMCGHGLISAGLARDIIERTGSGKISIQEAAGEIARPCVCDIANPERAAEIISRINDKGNSK